MKKEQKTYKNGAVFFPSTSNSGGRALGMRIVANSFCFHPSSQERDGCVNVLNSYRLDAGVDALLKENLTEV